ncbi:MAG: SDR family NAD(P)-dependent oxidoreductase [Verrucomicrobia bacterium]|nr:SDR family NAD(P)-dependent oxidoreductase [Verrucomicrobiota bacterium]
MKFLVTGGTGFIGSHVSERLLRDGNRVVIVDDFNDFYDPAIKQRNLARIQAVGRVKLHTADIVDKAAMDRVFAAEKFDAIIHLAARAGVRPSIEQPLLYTQTNVTGTMNLLECARAAGIRKFVFASSSSVYGINSKIPFSESDPIFKPISPYAATKLAGEALCHTYHHLYGMDMTCLRFFTVYGPSQRPDLAIHKFARLIAAGKPIEIFGDGSTRRDYTFIDDIVEGIMACVRGAFGYEIFNLGNSHTVELRQLVGLIESALGRKAIVERRPEQPGDVPVTFADVSKARRMLGYDPKTKIEQGIGKFVEWFQRPS